MPRIQFLAYALRQLLVWLIAGFLLVIVELVTGTFYMLVLAWPALPPRVWPTRAADSWEAFGAAVVAVSA